MHNLSLKRVWVILKREYSHRIFTRSFVGSTILMPAFLAVIIVVPVWLSGSRSHPVSSAVPPHVQAATIDGALAAIVLLYVLFISLFSYGAIVMRAVLEEKQSRVLEVLLCFASPEDLMTGKILGIGAVALTQVLIWIVISLAVIVFSATAHELAGLLRLGPTALICFILFDVLGYLLYSAMFCAIGGAFNSPDEAQQWMFVMVLPLVVTGMMISTILAHPDAPAAVVASIVPFTAPALMYARILIGHPPEWQVALSIVFLLGTIFAAIWLCARIYRVGILMYGKRPTVREIVRWMRYSS